VDIDEFCKLSVYRQYFILFNQNFTITYVDLLCDFKWLKYGDMFSRFDTISTCYEEVDGQKDDRVTA